MQRVTVTVPDGLNSGEEFTISFNETEYTVAVPDGVRGGEEIDLELPAAPESNAASSSSEMQKVVVTVPGGVGSGMPFTVEFDGQEFEVIVPEGLGFGDELEIELPASTQQPPPPQPPPQSQKPALGAGWDDWDAAWTPMPKGSTSWAEAPTPAPYYGRYKIGEKVQVQRTSGAWSPATIKEYDELSDCYTIELLVSRQLKYFVSENEIQPLEFEAEKCGEHFYGRRVQVPFVGAMSKDEVMGEVRAYDEATSTYTVALDSGTIKKGLVSDEIKVRPERKKYKLRPQDERPVCG